MVLPIHSLKNDQAGTIVWIASPPATLSRLRSFGLIPGRTVTCILSQIPGGVRAFRVCDSALAANPIPSQGADEATQPVSGSSGALIGLSAQTCREIFVQPQEYE